MLKDSSLGGWARKVR